MVHTEAVRQMVQGSQGVNVSDFYGYSQVSEFPVNLYDQMVVSPTMGYHFQSSSSPLSGSSSSSSAFASSMDYSQGGSGLRGRFRPLTGQRSGSEYGPWTASGQSSSSSG